MSIRAYCAGRWFLVLLPMAAVYGCETGPEVYTEYSYSLTDSQFEIDDDANLIPDDPTKDDWITVDGDEPKKVDEPSGQGDNSYKGGAKENDVCPAVGTGSIPNNKSDLKTFAVYKEPGNPGFLHLLWHRVQDPSGTTLMDFEFNHSEVDCGNGVNKVRTDNDLLIEYRLEQGGATATIKARRWDATLEEWGEATDLTAEGAAIGTINSSWIAGVDSDGLGPMDPRTFGEASIDLASIFDPNKCESFGSAFVKSRSSDAFNSALKDFIAPMEVAISNCGRVSICKETDPPGRPELFDFTHTMNTDPVSDPPEFQLGHEQCELFDNVLLGTGYTVTEEMPPEGLELTNLVCSSENDSVEWAIDLDAGTVTFDIDDPNDVLECTFKNLTKGKVTLIKETIDGAGSFDFTFTPPDTFFTLTTTGPGADGRASRLFDNLDPGLYTASEAAPPTGWFLDRVECDAGDGWYPVSNPVDIDVVAGGEVTCVFYNKRLRGAIQIHKTHKHAATGGDGPHPGVIFQVTGGELPAPVSVVTDTNGKACVDNLVVSDLVGDYTVTELVPEGYVADGFGPDETPSKTVGVVAAAGCADGNQVYYSNTPLTNLSVTVDSLVAGGTWSTITCTGVAPMNIEGDGDGTLSMNNLLPGTYSCEIVIDP